MGLNVHDIDPLIIKDLDLNNGESGEEATGARTYSGPFDRKIYEIDRIANALTGEESGASTGNRLADSLRRIADYVEAGGGGGGGGLVVHTIIDGGDVRLDKTAREIKDALAKNSVLLYNEYNDVEGEGYVVSCYFIFSGYYGYNSSLTKKVYAFSAGSETYTAETLDEYPVQEQQY